MFNVLLVGSSIKIIKREEEGKLMRNYCLGGIILNLLEEGEERFNDKAIIHRDSHIICSLSVPFQHISNLI